jgi:hypothetical protein
VAGFDRDATDHEATFHTGAVEESCGPEARTTVRVS